MHIFYLDDRQARAVLRIFPRVQHMNTAHNIIDEVSGRDIRALDMFIKNHCIVCKHSYFPIAYFHNAFKRVFGYKESNKTVSAFMRTKGFKLERPYVRGKQYRAWAGIRLISESDKI